MYKKLAIVTIAAVYFLILVGGVVRATGSGMGCPDWPKCFGSWIPPTSVDQLPLDYQQIFGEKLKGEVEFNAFRTWTEYINRLFGVLIGFLIFGTLLAAFREHRSSNPKVVWVSLLAFILVGAEGYLGAKVVSNELHPGLVTVHMILAIAVVLCLIYGLFLALKFERNVLITGNRSFRFVILILMILSFGQLLLGTQLREIVDEAVFSEIGRKDWITFLSGGRLYMHILLAIVILGLHGWFYRSVIRERHTVGIGFLKTLLALVISEFVIGGILGFFDIPAFAQPIHLTLATMIIGVQFSLFLMFGESKLIRN